MTCWNGLPRGSIQGVEGVSGSRVVQGMKVLGTPLGHEDYVARHLESVTEEQRVLLEGSTTSRVHGCCCCTALQHEQTTSSAQCPQKPRLILLRPTMQVCGDVCDPFCNPIRRSQTASVNCHSPALLGALGLRSASRRVCLHFG